MLSRSVIVVVALCVALATGCTGSDSGGSAGPEPDPGRPLQTLGEDGLPADFPRDEVPIVDGEVTSVDDGSEKNPGYSVAVVVDAPLAKAMADAVGKLEGAGWTQQSDGNAGRVAVLAKDGGQAIITSAPTSGQTLISYAIDLPSGA